MSGRGRKAKDSATTTTTTGSGGPVKKTRTSKSARHSPLSAPTKSTTVISSPAIDKNLAENFRCSICLEIFFEPVSLSCGHNFCKVCSLGKLLKNCPLCKSEVSNVVSLKVNSTLKALVQQFFGEEYAARENKWRQENDQWAVDVHAALAGGKLLTEPELYEAFRTQFERRTGSPNDLPTRQQFLYFLSHMKKTNEIVVLSGKPFLWLDPKTVNYTALMEEFKKRKQQFPPFAVTKRKWQQNWCYLIMQRIKEVDPTMYSKAKEVMDEVFDDFQSLEEFNENTPSIEFGLSALSSFPILHHHHHHPLSDSSDYMSGDSDFSDYD